ncbi:hypothetical protein V8G54_032375 [Vigna mungo]|uniref:Uncharacterized protein n=1 Tax=Vigna mungo TaxID=3915 RepID=A0AAQ3MLC8_VIGMU
MFLLFILSTKVKSFLQTREYLIRSFLSSDNPFLNEEPSQIPSFNKISKSDCLQPTKFSGEEPKTLFSSSFTEVAESRLCEQFLGLSHCFSFLLLKDSEFETLPLKGISTTWSPEDSKPSSGEKVSSNFPTSTDNRLHRHPLGNISMCMISISNILQKNQHKNGN